MFFFKRKFILKRLDNLEYLIFDLNKKINNLDINDSLDNLNKKELIDSILEILLKEIKNLNKNDFDNQINLLNQKINKIDNLNYIDKSQLNEILLDERIEAYKRIDSIKENNLSFLNEKFKNLEENLNLTIKKLDILENRYNKSISPSIDVLKPINNKNSEFNKLFDKLTKNN